MAHSLSVVDSHTAGEPTRLIVGGGPTCPVASMAEIRDWLAGEHDDLRTGCLLEPRGHDAVVGALLCQPTDPACAAGVVFFNNNGYLNGCIHGTLGVVASLAHLGRIGPGSHRLETPVGEVSAQLDGDGLIEVANVPSFRYAEGVEVDVQGHGIVRGDVAWGGNWFFLAEGQGPAINLANRDVLTRFCLDLREALGEAGVTGENGGEIDHIELFGPARDGSRADSRNFVLCPGGAYDRSPCGTGTSAKLACLAASGHLKPGETWRQAGILDTIFEARYEPLDAGRIRPHVTGRAYVTGESRLIFHEDDPFRHGIAALNQ